MSRTLQPVPSTPSFERKVDKAEVPTYLPPGVTAEAMASMFSAAADLYRVRLWKLVPLDTCLLGITSVDIGNEEVLVSVVGQREQCFGLVVFRSEQEFEIYTRARTNFELGQPANLPPFWVIDFYVETALPEALRREISEHDWDVADDCAYPLIMARDEHGQTRDLDSDDLMVLESVARALATVAHEPEKLTRVWSHDESFNELVTVATYHGEFGVWIAAPPDAFRRTFDPKAGLFENLRRLGQSYSKPDVDQIAQCHGELLGQFEESPQYQQLDQAGVIELVLDWADDYHAETAATLQAPQLRDIVFKIIPRELGAPASDAAGIIAELRAFYRFLQVRYDHRHAEACLEVLGADAPAKLEAAMADPRNFGMAKSMFMFMGAPDTVSRRPFEPWTPDKAPEIVPVEAPRSRDSSSKAAKAKKDKRKAARKSRKKNRK